MNVTPEQRLVSAILLSKAQDLHPTPTRPLERHLEQARDVRDFAARALRMAWLRSGAEIRARKEPLPVVALSDVTDPGRAAAPSMALSR